MMINGWIGVDYDGTLAHYTGWEGAGVEKPPVPAMIERVKEWLSLGVNVRVFTARVYPLNRCVWPDDKRELHGTWLDNSREDECWESIATIRAFCSVHLGVVLPITNVKDFKMVKLYDDRCVQVETNTGELSVEAAVEQERANQEKQ
jgi:hypothetical protein